MMGSINPTSVGCFKNILLVTPQHRCLNRVKNYQIIINLLFDKLNTNRNVVMKKKYYSKYKLNYKQNIHTFYTTKLHKHN